MSTIGRTRIHTSWVSSMAPDEAVQSETVSHATLGAFRECPYQQRVVIGSRLVASSSDPPLNMGLACDQSELGVTSHEVPRSLLPIFGFSSALPPTGTLHGRFPRQRADSAPVRQGSAPHCHLALLFVPDAALTYSGVFVPPLACLGQGRPGASAGRLDAPESASGTTSPPMWTKFAGD